MRVENGEWRPTTEDLKALGCRVYEVWDLRMDTAHDATGRLVATRPWSTLVWVRSPVVGQKPRFRVKAPSVKA